MRKIVHKLFQTFSDKDVDKVNNSVENSRFSTLKLTYLLIWSIILENVDNFFYKHITNVTEL